RVAVLARAGRDAGLVPASAEGEAGILSRLSAALKYLLLSAYLVAVVFPLCWLLYTSGKSTQEFFRNPLGLPEAITAPGHQSAVTLIENYTRAWYGSHFSLYFLNSLKVVAISLALTLLLGSMAA